MFQKSLSEVFYTKIRFFWEFYNGRHRWPLKREQRRLPKRKSAQLVNSARCLLPEMSTLIQFLGERHIDQRCHITFTPRTETDRAIPDCFGPRGTFVASPISWGFVGIHLAPRVAAPLAPPADGITLYHGQFSAFSSPAGESLFSLLANSWQTGPQMNIQIYIQRSYPAWKRLH